MIVEIRRTSSPLIFTLAFVALSHAAVCFFPCARALTMALTTLTRIVLRALPSYL
jgi:hypothetical protein